MTVETGPAIPPGAKALKRTGGCRAVSCTADCIAFEFHLVQDGYRLCTCGHTQIIHRLVEVAGTMNHGDADSPGPL